MQESSGSTVSTVQLPTIVPSVLTSTRVISGEVVSVSTPRTTPSFNLTTAAAAGTIGNIRPSTANVTTTKGVCDYGEWTPWTVCTKSCDVGQRSRSRSLVLENREMCTVCIGTTAQLEDCNSHPCEEWSTWERWSDCSATDNCTAGIRTRYRACSGANCDGYATDMERCGQWCPEAESNCPPGKIWVSCEDIELSLGEVNCHEFSFYESLGQDEDCQGGACVCENNYEHSESGECRSADTCPCYRDNGWAISQNASAFEEGCNICTCELDMDWSTGLYIPVLECTTNTYCCEWEEWTPWGSCNVSCGIGSKHRYRDLLNGEDCGPSIETDECVQECLPDCSVNGTSYSCGDVISENSTHTCYCVTGAGTDCIEKIPEVGECIKQTRTEILHDPASNCTSRDNVTVEYCNGTCGDSIFQGLLTFNKADTPNPSASCDCCRGTFSGIMEEVVLICGPDSEQRTAYLPKISKCSCSPCSGGATTVTLPETTRHTTFLQ